MSNNEIDLEIFLHDPAEPTPVSEEFEVDDDAGDECHCDLCQGLTDPGEEGQP